MKGRQLAVIKPVRKAANDVARTSAQSPAQVTQVVNEFQADTIELDTRPEPFRARATVWTLGALIAFAITWASIAQIDRVVTARGKIIATTPNLVVQPLESAIVRSINVKVGDIVKKGTILATLDPTFAKADVEQIEARIASLDAAVARLEAEQHDRPYVPDPTSSDNRFGYGELQKAIWLERTTEYTAQMRLYDERDARLQANIISHQQERDHLNLRLQILREIEGIRVELEHSQTGSRLNALLARDTRVEVERNLANAENAILAGKHELEGSRAERDVYIRQRESKLVEELVTKRNERDGLTEQLVKARKRQDMIRLETPSDAVVLEIAERSVGSIIREGEALVKLVPLDAPLEIEASIAAREIGFVAVGDTAQLKLDAYTFQEHGMAEGTVRVIASDTFADPRAGADLQQQNAFYKARIDIVSTDLHNVPDNFRLIPGMPLTAEIKVGHHSIISYFLRPILRGMNESMREP